MCPDPRRLVDVPAQGENFAAFAPFSWLPSPRPVADSERVGEASPDQAEADGGGGVDVGAFAG